MSKLKLKPAKVTRRLKAATGSRPPPEPPRPPEPPPAADKVEAAQRIEAVARGFRLGFGQLPQSKKLSTQQAGALLKDVKARRSMIKQAKALFDQHPAIQRLSAVKREVETFFAARTHPFPETGVRIYLLDSSKVNREMSTEQITAEYARQIEAFSKEVRELIAKYFLAVDNLIAEWHSVLESAKESLVEFFDLTDYPTASELKQRLYVRFEPYNIRLPSEYSYVSPEERQTIMQEYEARFREAVALQEEFVTKMMIDSLQQLVDSVRGYHAGTQRYFTNSVVEHVFAALREFKDRTVKYGIMEGTRFEEEFERVFKYVREGGANAADLPEILRRSPGHAADLTGKLDQVRQVLQQLSEQRGRKVLL